MRPHGLKGFAFVMGGNIGDPQCLFHQDGLFKLMLRDFFQNTIQRQVAMGDFFELMPDNRHGIDTHGTQNADEHDQHSNQTVKPVRNT